MKLNIEEMAIFCKKKGFVYPTSEIYSGLSGFFDFGPLGVELKNNIKSDWWKTFVQRRDDIVGLDGSIVSNQKVWVASGHVAQFSDILLDCPKCHNRVRADHFVESITNIPAEELTQEKISHMAKAGELQCPKCKTPFEQAKPFNLMFKKFVGPVESDSNVAYLRPETAQLIFCDFKLIAETSRLKLPFGVAQVGKAFRNEISPRDFLFRCREFEQMEIEYFVHPEKVLECPYIDDVMTHKLQIFTSQMQVEKSVHVSISMKEALVQGLIKNPWHAYWLSLTHQWFIRLGANPDHFRIRQHLLEEKSHYAIDTWDLEYKFPFGWKELQGIANRGDYDLSAHSKASGVDLTLFDQQNNQKVIPHVVAEPSLGVERAFLVVLFDAYNDDKERGNIVLKLSPRIAPFKVAIFPLLSNKEELVRLAKTVHKVVREYFPAFYDQGGSIGRRYARQDEVGTPYCITVDFESLERKDVTIRDRDSTAQARVPINSLHMLITGLIDASILFSSLPSVKNK